MKLASALMLALAVAGCATVEKQTVTQQKYVVVVPPQELLEPPGVERDNAMVKLDPEKATDVDLATQLLDKQNYINALEKQLAVLRKWYKERIELLKKNRDLKEEQLEVVN